MTRRRDANSPASNTSSTPAIVTSAAGVVIVAVAAMALLSRSADGGTPSASVAPDPSVEAPAPAELTWRVDAMWPRPLPNKWTVGQVSGVDVAPDDNEVYIADGYVNRRAIVFDATTGAYKRHWGAYGEPPVDGPRERYDPDAAEPSPNFSSPVHAVRVSNDGKVYVADRSNNRIQVFEKDGTFIMEKIFDPETRSMGSVWDIDFSPDPEQTYITIPDGSNHKVRIVRRTDMEEVTEWGQGGKWAGQFGWVHNAAVDADVNIYASEVETGKRVQKFVFSGGMN